MCPANVPVGSCQTIGGHKKTCLPVLDRVIVCPFNASESAIDQLRRPIFREADVVWFNIAMLDFKALATTGVEKIERAK